MLENIRAFFVPHIANAMQKVSQSRKAGYLIFFQDYMIKNGVSKTLKEFPDVNFKRASLIDEQYFQPVVNFKGRIEHLHYRLKPGVSASDAIHYILNNGMGFIDCKSGLILAHYIAILEMLKTNLGESQGKHYFDTLFGTANHIIPTYRRLLISTDGDVGGDGLINDSNLVNPICYFLDFSERTKTLRKLFQDGRSDEVNWGSLGRRELPVGSSCCVLNHPGYPKKHSPFALGNAFNVVKIGEDSKNGDLYLGYEFTEPVTELELLKKLTEEFNKPLQKVQQELVAHYAEPQPTLSGKITVDDVRGVMIDGVADINLQALKEMFMIADPLLMAAKVDQHIMSERKIALEKLALSIGNLSAASFARTETQLTSALKGKSEFMALSAILQASIRKENPEYQDLPHIPGLEPMLEQLRKAHMPEFKFFGSVDELSGGKDGSFIDLRKGSQF